MAEAPNTSKAPRPKRRRHASPDISEAPEPAEADLNDDPTDTTGYATDGVANPEQFRTDGHDPTERQGDEDDPPQDEIATFGDARRLARSPAAKDIVSQASALERRVDGRFAVPSLGFVYGLLVARPEYPNTTVQWFQDWLREKEKFELRVFLEQGIQSDTASADITPLTAQAALVIRRARALAEATVGRKTIDGRHIAAALVARGDPSIESAVIAPIIEALELDLRNFGPELLSRLRQNSFEEGEKVEEWERILAGPAIVSRPDYAADRPDPTAPDSLNIGPDVTAFAELICLENARPPLSIGLFGDWGSGKTFFMDRLKARVDDVAKTARETLGRGAETPFVPHVVQIRFNAWHYADANLWASLTAEFFDQLRIGGIDSKQGAAYDRLVGRVAAHVRSLETEISAWEKARIARGVEAGEKKKEVEQAREELKKKPVAIAQDAAETALKETFDTNKGAIKQVGDALGLPDLGANIAGYAKSAKDAVSVLGGLKLVFRAAKRIEYHWLLGAVVLLLIAIAALAAWLGDIAAATNGLKKFALWIGPFLPALAAAAVGLGRAWQVVQPILSGAAKLSAAMESETKALREKLKTKQAEYAKAEADVAAADKALEAARQKIAPYPVGNGKISQASLLRYFLFEDAETKEYDQHLGLVSRVRRSFETLDGLAAAGRKAAIAVAARKAAVAGAAAAGATPAAEHLIEEAAAEDYNAGRSSPHRIVLYIDDLDRCTHEQVYQVLQAVHLLLAFELFVVVVGVDVRWVEDALTRFFAHGGDRGNGSAGYELLAPLLASRSDAKAAVEALKQFEAEADRAVRHRAVAYLEKIFQIPFWLRPLSAGDENSTYARYVDGLLASNKPGPDGKTETSDMAQNGGTSGPLPVEEVKPLEDDGDSLARVIMTGDEVKFLKSQELGALAGASPRAIKRFINIYRLVRGRRGSSLRRFTGEDGSPPEFPIVATMLALETGASGDDVEAFHRALGSQVKASAEGLHQTLAALKADPATASDRASVATALARLPALLPALGRADKCRGNPTISKGDWLALADELRRYSFHRRDKAT